MTDLCCSKILSIHTGDKKKIASVVDGPKTQRGHPSYRISYRNGQLRKCADIRESTQILLCDSRFAHVMDDDVSDPISKMPLLKINREKSSNHSNTPPWKRAYASS